MPIRQQRAQFNRRPVRIPTPARTAILAARISDLQPDRLEVNFVSLSSPPNGAAPLAEVVLVQTPQLRRVATNAMPIGATLNTPGTLLTLNYPAPDLTQGDSFELGPYDPGLRTRTGGWVCPGVLALPVEANVKNSYSAASTGGNNVNLTFASGPTTDFDLEPINFRILETSELASTGSWSGGVLTLTFSGTPTPGQTIQYEGPEAFARGINLQVPDRSAVVLS